MTSRVSAENLGRGVSNHIGVISIFAPFFAGEIDGCRLGPLTTLTTVANFGRPPATGAIRATKNASILLHAMADDSASAVGATRRKQVNGAFE
jgi:hypothetical protein